MGRLLLTDEIQTNICNALRAGNFCEEAAVAFGLSTSTFWRYMQVGEDVAKAKLACEEKGTKWQPATKHDDRMLAFWDAVTRARAHSEIEAVALLRKGMKDDWRAAAWYLERAHPSRWGKRLIREGGDEENPALTQAQATLMAHAMRLAFESVGIDPEEPENQKLLRAALEGAASVA